MEEALSRIVSAADGGLKSELAWDRQKKAGLRRLFTKLLT